MSHADSTGKILRSPLSRNRERGLGGEGKGGSHNPTDPRAPGRGSKRRIPRANRTKLRLAREFRQEPTPSEARAWQILRDRQVLGLKFKRQKVVHGFVVDFYCAEHALVVEIDGSIHQREDVAQADALRTEALERFGIAIVRFENDEVEVETLRQRIAEALGLRPR